MAKDPSKNIPTASSPSSSWIDWHRRLKKTFGKKQANSIWVYAWSKRSGVDSQANTNTLSRYMEGEGVDVERTFFDEFGQGVGDFATDFGNVTKWILIGGLVIGGIIVTKIVLSIVNDPKGSARTAANFTPQGRTSKVLKK